MVKDTIKITEINPVKYETVVKELTYDNILDYGYTDNEYGFLIGQLVGRCKKYKSLVEGLQRINEEQEKEIQELKEEHKQERTELLSEMHKLKTIDYRNKYNRMKQMVVQIINLADTLKEEVNCDD